jgi:hypothetical protein
MIHEMDGTELLLLARARTAYELGRARGALLRALLLAASTALLGSAAVDAGAWQWAPITFVIWAFVWWRGGVLLSSGYYGVLAGALTFLFPMSLLRPCCRPGADGTMPTCTMPEMCVLAGALIALPLATWVLRKGGAKRAQAASGMALGVLSLATLKCSALFMGEALGLLAGMGLAIVTATALYGFAPKRA